MTKANKAIFWSLVVCVMALVVGLCFVGTTFARYTSSGTGTGEVTVAKWDVAVDTNGIVVDTSVTASPSEDDYTDTSYNSNAARSNKSAPQLACLITNSGSVAASVTAEIDETAGLTFNWDTTNLGSDSETTSGGRFENYSDLQTAAADHFTIELLQDDGSYYDNGSYSNSTATAESLSELGGAVTVDPNDSLYIYADVLWTSDIEGCFGDDADEFDSFCGMYLSSISFTINFTAVQASAN